MSAERAVSVGHPVSHRRGLDAIGLAAGLVGFGLTALLADHGIAPGEAGFFKALNGLPDWLDPLIWPFMQYGVFLTIPVLSLVALALRRPRLAGAMLTAGIGVYFLAKLVKEFVQRGRPDRFVNDVVEREPFGQSLGYPSGHAAVAAALTVVVTPYLRGRWKVVPSLLLVVVILGRTYVAAHLPLDLLGGAALGVAVGSAANLVVGVPEPLD